MLSKYFILHIFLTIKYTKLILLSGLITIIFFPENSYARQYLITTVAGNGTSGHSGDGGLATDAEITTPFGLARDTSGNLFIAEKYNNTIRKVDSAGIISTVAGTGTAGYFGDGGPATDAKLNSPRGVAVDATGNIYIADEDNNRIRKVDNTSGIITTIAGIGSGYSGDGGSATAAILYRPYDVAVDTSGNIFIADRGNSSIRKIDSSGIITTVAGNGPPSGYSGDGGLATSATMKGPEGLTVDTAGNIFIGNATGYRVRKVDTSGIISTVAGIGSYGYSGDGGLATLAKTTWVRDVAVDTDGNIYIADTRNNRIRMVDTSGIITTIAGTGSYSSSGDGGLAAAANTYQPSGIIVDATGNLYIAETNGNRIRYLELLPPFVSSITRNTPTDEDTNANSVEFLVTFSEDVTGINMSDFALNTSGVTGYSITSISSGNCSPSCTVVVNTGTSNGSIRLDVTDDNSITSTSTTWSLSDATGEDDGDFTGGESYTIDKSISTPSTPDMTSATDAGNSNTDDITNNNTATFTGTAEDNSTVELFYNSSNSLGSISADASGDWTITATTIPEGSQSITAKATDMAGNISAMSSALNIQIDTTKPNVTVNQAGGQTDPTSSGPINFTATFDKSIIGFATGDVIFSGSEATTAIVTETSPNDGTTYNIAVSGMTGHGSVIASIDTSKATDNAGNNNTASTSNDNSVQYYAISDLIINEIDYDQIGTDNAEFIELYNKGGTGIDLSLYEILLINGLNGNAYTTIDTMTGTLSAGDFYVICGDSANVSNCNLDVSTNTNLIQNDNESIALVVKATNSVVDALTYKNALPANGDIYSESSNAATDNGSIDSLSRTSDGADTNDNSTDFELRGITPGTTNTSIIQFSQSTAYSTNENIGTSNEVTLTRSGFTDLVSSIQVSITVGTAISGTDYTNTDFPKTINFIAGEISKTVAITITDDSLYETTTDETITFSLSSATNSVIGTQNTATLNITENDSQPTVTLSLSNSPLAENAGTATITAALSHKSIEDITANLAFSGTATVTDYSKSDSIDISANNTSNTMTITGNNDSLDEENETIIVDINSVDNGTENGIQAVTATITDDDISPTVSFTSASQNNAENIGTATITVQLSTVSGRDVSIQFNASGTANSTDYNLSSSPVTISMGDTTADITVTISDDSTDEPDETVIIDMGTLIGVDAGTTTSHTITIQDNDASLVINEIDYEQPSTDTAEFIEIKNIGNSTINLDSYTIDLYNNSTSTVYKTIDLPDVDLVAGEFYVICSNADTVINCDLDHEKDSDLIQNGPQDAIALKLGTFVVDTVSYAGTSTNSLYTETTGADADSSSETNVSLSRYADGTDTNDNSNDITLRCITPGLTNNVAANSACYQLSINNPTATENSTNTLQFTASLSNAAPFIITVDYATADNTATNSDYESQNGTLTFNANDISKTIDISINDDEIDENVSETFYVNLSNVSKSASISDNQGIGTITDDDTAGITLSKLTASVNESGTTDSFTVVLDSEPTSNVEITVSSGDTGEATVDKSSLTFTANDWDTVQVVTITGIDDVLFDNNQTTSVTLSVVDDNSDDIYDSLKDQTVSVITADNDTPGVTVSPTSLTISEPNDTANFTINLNTQPTADVTISSISASNSECSVVPTSTTIAIADWNTGTIFTVTAQDDNSIDSNQTCTIQISNSTSTDGSYNIDLTDVIVTVQDDDIASVNGIDGNINLTESGKTDSYNIKLTSQPTGDVEIIATADSQTEISNDDGITFSNSLVLTFTNSDWNDNQTVTVQAIDDTVIEGNHTSTISHSIMITSDDNYPTSLVLGDITANIVDNDIANSTSTTLSSTMNVIVKFAGLGSGTVISNPSSIDCNTEDDECQAEFDTASKVTLTATADSGSEFDYWSGQDCDTEMFMTNNHTCTAYFKLTPRTLTVSYPENGSITSSPNGIDCGNNKCNSEFEGGETITLSATANDGYIFDSWSENCVDGKVELLEDTTCSATFELEPEDEPVEPDVPSVSDPTVIIDNEPVIQPDIPIIPEEPTIPSTINTVSFTEQNYEVAENAGKIDIAITRTGTEGKVTVELHSSEDGYNITETLVWDDSLDGDISIPITIIDNDIVDGNKEVILSLGNAENTNLELDTSVLTIIDDDKLPVIYIDELATPATTSLPTIANNTCSSGTIINTTCDFNWNIVKDNIVIKEKGNISYATIESDINNEGRISNSKIIENVQVTGGILTGYITNFGTLSNFEFVGASITGMNGKGEIVGILSGKIFNNSEIGGSFENIRLAPNTHIIGGILEQQIIGDKEQPATLESLLIKSESIISNVIIGDDVEFEKDVTLVGNVSFSVHTNYMKANGIIQLPMLGNSIIFNPRKNETTISFARFTGGILKNTGTFERKTTIKRKSQVTIKSNLLVDVRHIGKQADILVVAVHNVNDGFYMLNSTGKPIIWNGKFSNLLAFQKQVNLTPVEQLDIWNEVLDIAGSVIVYVGYRLTDGRIVYSPTNFIEMDFIE